MINFINKFSRVSPRGKAGSAKGPERREDLPLDHQLTFNPEPDEKWTFEEGRGILLDDEDVKAILSENGSSVRTLCGLSQGLYDYQQFVWGKGGKDRAAFNGTVASLQDSILGRLGSLYDGLTAGVHFECLGEDFWVNNVNIRSVLKLYILKPTEAARHYIEGLRDKLGLILSRQQSSTRYDAVHEKALQLLNEISMVLECVPTAGHPRLCA
ncbi:MAG: hypothetical protein WC956_01040 [bacterium]